MSSGQSLDNRFLHASPGRVFLTNVLPMTLIMVMNGLLTVEVTPLVSRLVTAIPAVMILALGVDPTRTLVISQVVLSFGIPFVLIPLLTLTARRSVLARPLPKLVYWLAVVCAALIVALNVALLISLL